MEKLTDKTTHKWCDRWLSAKEIAENREEVWAVLSAQAPEAANFITAMRNAFSAHTMAIRIKGDRDEH